VVTGGNLARLRTTSRERIRDEQWLDFKNEGASGDIHENKGTGKNG
jgi:hypothetical protein